MAKRPWVSIRPRLPAVLAAVLFLVLYMGLGWRCEVQPDKSSVVLRPGMFPWATEDIADLCLLREGDLLHGWVDASNGSGYDIHHILSFDDGLTWKDSFEGPLIGRDAEWARNHVTSPAVLRGNGKLEMWYGATSHPRLAVGYQVGHASSKGSEGWIKDPNPVLALSGAEGNDNFSIADPCVLAEGSGYRMWYSGAAEFKGLPLFRVWTAESSDGINWTGRTEVVDDLLLCAAPHVERFGGTDHLWYAVARQVQAGAFQELRYRYRRWFTGWGWFPWSRQTILANGDLGPPASHSLYSPCIHLKEEGEGWLYVSVHDSQGVWRVARMPMRLRRTCWGISV